MPDRSQGFVEYKLPAKFDWQIARPVPGEKRPRRRPQPHQQFGEYIQSRRSAICQCFAVFYKLGHVLYPCALHKNAGPA